jgi:acyl-CoA synthetase (AMP-forming)/AMP-acid ligase II
MEGILLTRGNIMAMLKATRYYFKLKTPVVLQHSDWTCDLSLFQTLFALSSGGTLILASTIDSSNISKIMVQQKCTVTIATPSEYTVWFQQPLNMLSSCDAWQLASCTGENMSSAVLRNFAAMGNNDLVLVSVYGATETTIGCSMGVVDYKKYSADTEGRLIPVGSTLPNCQLWIGDHLGRALPPAWTRDIWVTDTGISGVYFGAGDVDDHWFQTRSDTGARCFRTGDSGFINDTGVLFVVSRRFDESVASIRLHHVELGDISLAIIDKANGKIVQAVVTLHKDNEADEHEEP